MRDICLGVLVALLLSTLEVCGAPLPKVDKDTKLRWAHFKSGQQHKDTGKKDLKAKRPKDTNIIWQYRVLDALFGQQSAHNDAPVGSEININFHGVSAPLNAGTSHTITHGDRGD